MKVTNRREFEMPGISDPVKRFEDRVVANPAYYKAAREFLGFKSEIVRETLSADSYEYEAIVAPPSEKIPGIVVSAFGGEDTFKMRETFRYDRRTHTGVLISEPVGSIAEGRSRTENRMTVTRLASATPSIEFREDFEMEVRIPFVGGMIEKAVLKTVLAELASLTDVVTGFLKVDSTEAAKVG